MKFDKIFDVIVIGGGHAGIEAALAAARMGGNSAMLTLSVDTIGTMPCNPAIGGLAKGHLAREVDALGGEMGKIADATGIHFKMLNTSKGPAVWSPRCQNDREMYSAEAQASIRNESGIEILEDGISSIHCSNGENGAKFRISAITTTSGLTIKCLTAVICAGTFLRALMHTGMQAEEGGRFGEPSSNGITDSLLKFGMKRQPKLPISNSSIYWTSSMSSTTTDSMLTSC